MNEEIKRFRNWELIKKIAVILFWMYVVVVIKSPVTRLPGINEFFVFYCHLFEVLSTM